MLTLLVSGIGVATPIVLPLEPEQLVEGHTVFTVVELFKEVNTTEEHFAAAVAVLVRERINDRAASRFPGVLWFNDQYLVNPSRNGPSSSTKYRNPCQGAVIATDEGDITAIDFDVNGIPTIQTATYGQESYLITDPNEHSWTIDLWNTSYGTHLWSVSILNSPTNGGIPDDGTSGCGTFNDNWCYHTNTTVTGERCDKNVVTDQFLPDMRRNATGTNGRPYRNVEYNALLYMRLDHLGVPGTPKNHTEFSSDWWADTNACDAGHPSYPCPGNDDDREGNSHPFNPEPPWPLVDYDGKNNHGGSADCDADDYREMNCHATRRIDVYYGYVAPPLVRNYVLIDTVGAEAPYHCHETLLACGPYG